MQMCKRYFDKASTFAIMDSLCLTETHLRVRDLNHVLSYPTSSNTNLSGRTFGRFTSKNSACCGTSSTIVN